LGQPTAQSPWFNETSPNPELSWGYDFNHESKYTQALVDSVNGYWLREFKFDGIRFDFTKGFTNTPGNGQAYDQARINILTRMYNHIRSVNENAYIIFEHITDNEEEKVLADLGILFWGKMTEEYTEGAWAILITENLIFHGVYIPQGGGLSQTLLLTWKVMMKNE
jgi:hypothetical protein